MDKRDITETGFKAGYRLYIQTPDPDATLLPDCPFPLRTGERSQWLRAWARGKLLAREHRDAFDATLAEMVSFEEEV